jgi:hypothetical protein
MSHRDGLYDVRTEFRPYHGASHCGVAPMSKARTEFSETPQEGDEAVTTVEARGCPDPRTGCREHNRGGSVGRAAGALLTGQCQDGQSQVPARSSTPGPLTAVRGLFPTDAYIASDIAEGGRLCDHGKGLVVTRIGFVRFMWPRLMRRTGW